jgi:NAD(P)-dependent dehydrogenase (short-subunit alcohol dehydrogenase family)
MERLDGKRIIITGGTSGMGQAMVEAFPGLGAQVVFFGRREDAGNKIAAASGATFMRVDVADETAFLAAIDDAVRLMGGLDVFVHAAGIDVISPAEDITRENWDRTMTTNATSTYVANVAVFPHFKAQGYGNIVNFTSSTGMVGYPGSAHYAASKGAVAAWTRSLAMEWGRYNIRVNMIAPGIHTPMYEMTLQGLTPEQRAQAEQSMARTIPLGGKMGDPDTDFVPVMAFVCSDSSRFITGQVFSIDGGMVMMR